MWMVPIRYCWLNLTKWLDLLPASLLSYLYSWDSTTYLRGDPESSPTSFRWWHKKAKSGVSTSGSPGGNSPAVPHIFCETLGKSHRLSVPQFPSYRMGITGLVYCTWLLWGYIEKLSGSQILKKNGTIVVSKFRFRSNFSLSPLWKVQPCLIACFYP